MLYRFTGSSDGATPGSGNVVFDQAGNLYGTTTSGGVQNCEFGSPCGVVYELTPSNGGWTESGLYSFQGGSDGDTPEAGVIFDQAGNLYDTTAYGGLACPGNGCGTVFRLAPSGPDWTEKVLYTFRDGGDGANPEGGLIFDQSGNLYGTAANGGASDGGTVFELTPSSGNWTLALLYSLVGIGNPGPFGNLTMDAAGNLYGTTAGDGAYGYGSVFKLTPSNGGWTYTSLHDFCSSGIPCSDGAYPYGNVILDENGNLFGTASCSGPQGYGVVFEITP